MDELRSNCIISIFGSQATGEDEDPDSLELVTDGSYTASGNAATFRYEESELTGLEGTTTTFEVAPDKVVMTREGTVNAQMVFQEGKKHYFAYETPFGAMMMGVDTHAVRSRLDDAGGDLEIRYAIDMNNNLVSRNTFHISIRKA